jgi:putative ABC transport system substrate-binding protein
MSYGPDQRAIFRRAAAYADKISKGTEPSKLPVEQPTPALLARADEIIE